MPPGLYRTDRVGPPYPGTGRYKKHHLLRERPYFNSALARKSAFCRTGRFQTVNEALSNGISGRTSAMVYVLRDDS